MARPPEFWNRVRTEYTCGIKQPDGKTHFPTMRELAGTYKISNPAIAQMAKKQNWQREQAEISKVKVSNSDKLASKISKAMDKVVEAKAGDLANEYIDFDLECIRQARRAIGLIKTALDEIEKKITAEGKCAVPPQMIDRYMSALEKAQRIGKNAAGEKMPNNPGQFSMDDLLESERAIRSVSAEVIE